MKKIEKAIKELTYSERTKKKLKRYNEKVQQFREMSSDELDMRYIEIITTYEQRKNVVFAVFATLFITVIMDIWKYFFKAIDGLTMLMYENEQNADMINGTLAVTYIISVAVMIVILFIVADLARGLKKATSEKVFIEHFMKQATKENIGEAFVASNE